LAEQGWGGKQEEEEEEEPGGVVRGSIEHNLLGFRIVAIYAIITCMVIN
jgi:hypothetical protein